jgi:hypothetical protein
VKYGAFGEKTFDGGTTAGQDRLWRWDNDLVVAIFVPIHSPFRRFQLAHCAMLGERKWSFPRGKVTYGGFTATAGKAGKKVRLRAHDGWARSSRKLDRQ